jgi:hypothetical protein
MEEQIDMSQQPNTHKESLYPVAFTLSITDQNRLKVMAQKREMSFSHYVRKLVVKGLNEEEGKAA